MPEGEAVDVGMRSILGAAIIEKATNFLDPAYCVDDKSEAVEFAHSVNAARAYCLFTVLDVPEL